MKKYTLPLMLLLSITKLSAQNEVQTYVLDNGFTVILNEDHQNTTVFGAIVVKAGAKDDPEDATGMAHYMEHMLFKGTTQLGTSDWQKEKPIIDKIVELYDTLSTTSDEKKRKEIQQQINEMSKQAGEYTILNELSDIIKLMGGTHTNAQTSPDLTRFFNEFPPNQINQWLDLYAHRFINPVFRAFQAELETVYEEKNMYEDIMFTKLIEAFNKNFFKKHPYGQRTTIGTAEDLKNPRLSKMIDFYNKWYVAGNMALVLSGDFDTEQILPIIREKFAALPTGTAPEHQKYVEEPFSGRELVKVRMSPIKIGGMGYRVPTVESNEKLILDITAKLLNNSGSTGLLDQLMIDGKLLAAQAVQMPYQDYGCFLVLCIPKLIGQKFEEVEALVKEQIAQITAGNFTEEQLTAIKNEFYVEQQLKLESTAEKTLALTNAFSLGIDPKDALNTAQKIQNITKDDVIKTTAKYLGDNYLMFQSKMGSAKKEKVDKPEYDPITTKTNATSEYRKQFDQMPAAEYTPAFVDFNKDVQRKQLAENIHLIRTNNEANDIFTLQIRFGVGTYKIKNLEHAAEYMNLTGTDSMTFKELRQKLAELGITCNFASDKNYTAITAEGMEKNLAQALPLINDLMNNPKPDSTKIKTLYDSERGGRKMMQKIPDNIAHALYQYALYGEKSEYLDRITIADLKNMSAQKLINIYKEATLYEVNIFYTGRQSITEVEKQITENLKFNKNLKPSTSPEYLEPVKYEGNTLFLTDVKKALQAKIYLTTSSPLNFEERAMLEVFNMYMGGDFSGLLLQEIREYRSMAYSAGGGFKIPQKRTSAALFTAFASTQSDKANGVIDLLDSIITQMPQKPERLAMIKSYLINKTISDKPTVRELPLKIREWENQDYTSDPREELIKKYETITWEEIYAFYEKMLKNNRFVWTIAGDKSRINMKELEQYGTVKIVKQKQLFSK